MLNWLTNIYPQVTVILKPSSVPPEDYQAVQQGPRVTRSNSEFISAMNMPEIQILRMPVSSAGIRWLSEQGHEYLEIGEALSEMVGLKEDDEWRIDKPVYAAACRIAAELMAASYPAPRIFNHGPQSVVFNWSIGTNNLYLTISSNRISALLSSTEHIERRIGYSYSANQLPNPALFLFSIQPGHWGQPFALIKAVSDPPALFD
jgi:hypothetical protein